MLAATAAIAASWPGRAWAGSETQASCPQTPPGRKDALYGQKIAISASNAGNRYFAPALADLKRYLEGITGKSFEISQQPAEPDIRLSLSDSADAPEFARQALQGRSIEAFLICGGPGRLTIVANDPHGLSHGVYYYLERLGMRWLLPGDRWTITPHREDISLEIGLVVEPEFRVRTFAGTGGFFSWRWGRSYSGSAERETAYTNWARRLRFGGQYTLGRHMGEAFIADKTILPILQRHPEYLAQVKGKRSPLFIEDKQGRLILNTIAKLDAGNPDAVALFCDWTIRRLREARKSPDRTLHSVFSVEPSDGYGYGDNVEELPGNGSSSDQSFYIADTCVQWAAKEFPGVSGIILAYAGHAEPPSFPIAPNLIVQLAPYAFQPTPPELFIARWRKKTKRLALYDYWSIPDWTHDEPTFDFIKLASKLRYWRNSDIEALNAETSYGAGAIGIAHYVAGHMTWNLALDERAMIDEWFSLAFGPARAPMQKMIERWARSFRLTSQELGLSFADLAEARRLATPGSAEMGRIDDFAAYLHYLRLRLEMVGEPDAKKQIDRADALTAYLLDIDDRLMVHTTRIIDLDARSYPGSQTMFARSGTAPPGPGWDKVRRLSHADIDTQFANDARAYPPADWAPIAYSGPLRPAPDAPSAPAPDTNGPVMSVVGNLDLDVVIAPGEKGLRLKVTRGVDNALEIHDRQGRSILTRAIKGGAPDVWETLVLPLEPGEYQLVLRPSEGRTGGYFKFQAPAGARIALSSFLVPKQTPSPRLYFYVPKGLRQVVAYLPGGDFNGAYKFEILDPDGKPAAVRYQDGSRIVIATVPAGQDGRTWSLRNAVSPNEPMAMLTTPQALALTPQAALTTADALYRAP
ncbi:MAG: DUF4838 domain-containing protein [Rhodoblastus sp.]